MSFLNLLSSLCPIKGLHWNVSQRRLQRWDGFPQHPHRNLPPGPFSLTTHGAATTFLLRLFTSFPCLLALDCFYWIHVFWRNQLLWNFNSLIFLWLQFSYKSNFSFFGYTSYLAFNFSLSLSHTISLACGGAAVTKSAGSRRRRQQRLLASRAQHENPPGGKTGRE